jgi:hypothetical protein
MFPQCGVSNPARTRAGKITVNGTGAKNLGGFIAGGFDAAGANIAVHGSSAIRGAAADTVKEGGAASEIRRTRA